MALPKPANRPRIKIAGQHRASLNKRVEAFFRQVRPVATVSNGGGGKVAVGEAVKIVAGAAKGKSGVVVFNAGGVAYVRVGADVIKVLADYLALANSSSPPGPAPN